MYLNIADTSRDPASFWTPEAYDRLRRIKAAVDPGDLIRANHSVPPHQDAEKGHRRKPARRTRPRQPPRPAAMTSTPLYGALGTTELAALQEGLYTAAERAYRMVSLALRNQGWLARYRPVHTEPDRPAAVIR
jgi:hypothetical protein